MHLSKRALRVSLLVGVLAALFCVFTCQRFLTRSIGSGPTLPAVSRAQWTNTWRTSPVVFVGLGDSVTAGFGSTPSHPYFDRIVANPTDEFADMKGVCLRSVFPNLSVNNISIGGTTSAELVEMQHPKLEKASPEALGLIVMTTGGNDLIHNYGRTPPREGAMYGATVEQAKPWIESFEKLPHGLLSVPFGHVRRPQSVKGLCRVCRQWARQMYTGADSTGQTFSSV